MLSSLYISKRHLSYILRLFLFLIVISTIFYLLTKSHIFVGQDLRDINISKKLKPYLGNNLPKELNSINLNSLSSFEDNVSCTTPQNCSDFSKINNFLENKINK